MSGLKDRLVRIEQKFGKNHWMAQQVRDQIAAKGTSAQELWLTGSVPRQGNKTTPQGPANNRPNDPT